MSKTLTEIIKSRKSVRAYLDKPVSNNLIKELLIKASQSPSGGNLQPWKIYIINEQSMKDFIKFQNNWKGKEEPPYPIYPEKLKEPYRTSRFELGEQMYSILGIEKNDKDARINQVMKNFRFFDAPSAFFCFVDRQMGSPQWSDLGMFLQTFMLLAEEKELSTCAQESWSLKNKMVSAFVNADEDLILFCGISIGYQDFEADINQFKTKRRDFDDWAKFVDTNKK